MILLSQNRMAARDRHAAEEDYRVNVSDAEVNNLTLTLLQRLHADHTRQLEQHTAMLTKLESLLLQQRQDGS